MIKVTDYKDDDGNPSPEVSIVCDGCGEEYFDTEDQSRWCPILGKSAEDVAFAIRDDIDFTDRQGWHTDDDGHDYCPRCAHYNDNHLDDLVIHPPSKRIRDVIEFNLALFNAGKIEGDKLILPLEMGRKAKWLIHRYRDLLLTINEEVADAREELKRYIEDDDIKDYFDGDWNIEDMLKLRKKCVERIAGEYVDGEK